MISHINILNFKSHVEYRSEVGEDKMIATSILIGIVSLIFIVNYNLKRLKLYNAAAKLPGPWALPVIGNFHTLFVKSTKGK